MIAKIKKVFSFTFKEIQSVIIGMIILIMVGIVTYANTTFITVEYQTNEFVVDNDEVRICAEVSYLLDDTSMKLKKEARYINNLGYLELVPLVSTNSLGAVSGIRNRGIKKICHKYSVPPEIPVGTWKIVTWVQVDIFWGLLTSVQRLPDTWLIKE